MRKREFDFQPTLVGDTLTVRPLLVDDFDALYAAASDPKIWEGHPAQDRYKRDVFSSYFKTLIDAGGALAIVDHLCGVIGCSRYYVAPDQPDDISIGFTFLNNEYWGGKTNFFVKELMLDHAFKSFDNVWFHIAPSNVRSQRATTKLGAQLMYTATLTLSDTPATWMCFRLNRLTGRVTFPIHAVGGEKSRHA